MRDPESEVAAPAQNGTATSPIAPGQKQAASASALRQKKPGPMLGVIEGGGAREPVASLTAIEPVKQYLDRIGATPINFRTATITEVDEHGYPNVTGRVTFSSNGAIKVWGNAAKPDDGESKAIGEAFEGVELPYIVPLAAIAEGPHGVELTDKNLFVCHDFERRIVMLHQRFETRDGGKGFMPWTRWSDGQWRNMEPDVMPFFGIPGHEDATTLVIHEGGKAARRVKAIIAGEDGARFPWREEMRWAHHVGWLGGVHAVERSDWERLAGLGWRRVIIVADNDRHGLRAARKIARKFLANVFILAFDQRFAEGFDCGDDWPTRLFDEHEFYTGPAVDDCLQPATWATRLLLAQGRGRPPAVIRAEFAATVAYTVSPPRFIFRHRPNRDLSAEEFNAKVAPFSDVRKETASKLQGEIECQHDKLIYDPRHGAGTITVGNERCFNVFQPARVRAAPGDISLWEEYLGHLIPDAVERELVKKWLATLIAKPAVRMRYGLLLISTTHGVGKNTLANILKPLLGQDNVSFPSEHSVVESQFNGWLARKRLIFIPEIYSGHSRKAYDKLKSVLADDDVEANLKGIDQYRLDNWATVIACSNSEAALHLDDEDRRWFVPTIAEALQPRDWWQRLYRWIEGEGPGTIMRWAQEYVAEHGHVHTGDHAPDSTRKRAIVEESRPPGQKLAVAFAEHLTELPEQVIVRISEVRKWIALQRGFRRGSEPDLGERRLESPATILAAMKKVKGVAVWADTLRPKFGATREAVVMNFSPHKSQRWADIKEHLTDLEGVNLDEPL